MNIIPSFNKVMETCKIVTTMTAHKKVNRHLKVLKALDIAKKLNLPKREREKNVDPLSRVQDEVCNCHGAQLEAPVNEYEQHGDSSEVACVKAENALLPVYRIGAEKSTLGVFTLDACHEERFDLP